METDAIEGRDFVMDIKLIAIDIDGTLVNSKGQLTPKVKETIKQATAQGIKVVICTGRR